MSDFLTSEQGLAMLEIVPDYYRTSTIFKSYLQAVGTELDEFKAGVQDILDQFFVNSADWSLEQWEEELGIIAESTKPDSQRRSTIIGKLRGIGTVTFNMIETVANAYENGTVEVEEHPETYSFIVKFTDVRGIPPNLEDLQAAIEAIKPAHLAVTYEFLYLIYDELKASEHTYDQLLAHALTYTELMTWEPV